MKISKATGNDVLFKEILEFCEEVEIYKAQIKILKRSL